MPSTERPSYNKLSSKVLLQLCVSTFTSCKQETSSSTMSRWTFYKYDTISAFSFPCKPVCTKLGLFAGPCSPLAALYYNMCVCAHTAARTSHTHGHERNRKHVCVLCARSASAMCCVFWEQTWHRTAPIVSGQN